MWSVAQYTTERKVRNEDIRVQSTPIVIKDIDKLSNTLRSHLNHEGYNGWELVQWSIIPPSAFTAAMMTPCCNSILILATFKKEVH